MVLSLFHESNVLRQHPPYGLVVQNYAGFHSRWLSNLTYS